MYFLWKQGKIHKPSDYWNMDLGDKIVTRAFYEKYLDEKYEKTRGIKQIIPVYSVQI